MTLVSLRMERYVCQSALLAGALSASGDTLVSTPSLYSCHHGQAIHESIAHVLVWP